MMNDYRKGKIVWLLASVMWGASAIVNVYEGKGFITWPISGTAAVACLFVFIKRYRR